MTPSTYLTACVLSAREEFRDFRLWCGRIPPEATEELERLEHLLAETAHEVAELRERLDGEDYVTQEAYASLEGDYRDEQEDHKTTRRALRDARDAIRHLADIAEDYVEHGAGTDRTEVLAKAIGRARMEVARGG